MTIQKICPISKYSVASAYLFGLPALYAVLTAAKKETVRLMHAEKALRMWLWFFVGFFMLRLVINLIWRAVYVPHLEKLELVLVVYLAYYAIAAAFRAIKEL